MVYSWLNNAQFKLLPGQCVLCRGGSGRAADLCAACEAELTAYWPRCRHCGLPGDSDSDFCGHCSPRPFAFHHCIALAPYRAPLDQLIVRYKYQRCMAAGKVLSQLLAGNLRRHYAQDQWPRVLLPVPLHWRRQWRRGFNQAHYIAATLGRQLDIPLQVNCLTRTAAGPSQQGMDRRQRLRNLRHAFALRAPPAAKHVALIDDVVTTGSTANSLCRLLRQHGATRVDVWCLGRTPAKH